MAKKNSPKGQENKKDKDLDQDLESLRDLNLDEEFDLPETPESEEKDKDPREPVGSSPIDVESLREEIKQELLADIRKTMSVAKEEKPSVDYDLSGVNRELIKALRDMTMTHQANKTDSEYGYVKEEDLDPDDVLETPATFFAPGTGYLIIDDVRQGKSVRIPNEPNGAFFKFMSVKGEMAGRENNVRYFCSYSTRSKKTKEWLENHSCYRVKFYPATDNLTELEDYSYIHLVSRYLSQLNAKGSHDIFHLAQENGIPVSNDVTGMRAALASRWAKEESKELQSKARLHTIEARKEEAVIAQ